MIVVEVEKLVAAPQHQRVRCLTFIPDCQSIGKIALAGFIFLRIKGCRIRNHGVKLPVTHHGGVGNPFAIPAIQQGIRVHLIALLLLLFGLIPCGGPHLHYRRRGDDKLVTHGRQLLFVHVDADQSTEQLLGRLGVTLVVVA